MWQISRLALRLQPPDFLRPHYCCPAHPLVNNSGKSQFQRNSGTGFLEITIPKKFSCQVFRNHNSSEHNRWLFRNFQTSWQFLHFLSKFKFLGSGECVHQSLGTEGTIRIVKTNSSKCLMWVLMTHFRFPTALKWFSFQVSMIHFRFPTAASKWCKISDFLLQWCI